MKNKKNAKVILKQVIRECLFEILTEEFIKTSVKKAINENVSALLESNSFMNEINEEPKLHDPSNVKMSLFKEEVENKPKPKPKPKPEHFDETISSIRSEMMDDDPYGNIMKDTANSGHPLITGEDTGESVEDNPFDYGGPQVSRDKMKQMGLIK